MPTPIIVETSLPATPADVWAHASTMAGVNYELAPLLRMTYPKDINSLAGDSIPIGDIAFRSWLLLGGILPIDRHALRLLRVTPGEGFHEESSSWMQRRWTHIRTITAAANGCILRDEVGFEPWIPFVGPIVRPIVDTIFHWRHRRLRRRFKDDG